MYWQLKSHLLYFFINANCVLVIKSINKYVECIVKKYVGRLIN